MMDTKTHKRALVQFYVLTLLVMGLGSAFAIYQNWQQHLATTQATLVRDASIASALIDGSLLSAAKSLDLAKNQLTDVVHSGHVDQARVYQILTHSVNEFIRYTPAEVYGLLFFVDKNGHLFARSGEYPTKDIDFTDRFYYQDLRDNPNKARTIGPIVKARTTGKYVFHIAVPILDRQGEFYGELVQQIQIDDLNGWLEKNLDGLAEQVVMHHLSQGFSFAYPASKNHEVPINVGAIAQAIATSELKRGCISFNEHQSAASHSMLLGFDESSTFGFVTSATLSLARVVDTFVYSNRYFLIYILLGALLVPYLFFRLYRQYTHLERSQFISRHDALTTLHNRWALNEELPMLLHEAMRRQTPISFLFVDIDHFKAINDTYGHKMGDVVLSAIAKALEGCVRRPLDFLCRWGGEEFLILMPDTFEDNAVTLAEAMMAAVKAIKIGEINLKLSISIGLKTVMVTLENMNDNHLMDAEAAMMRAKENGRDRYEIFSARS